MEDVSPDEIKEYVAVGPTEDLSITVHKETFDSTFIIFTILFGLTILVIIGVTILIAYQESKLPPPPPPLTASTQQLILHSNFGAANNPNTLNSKKLSLAPDASEFITQQQCENSINTIWTGSECKCEAPFFGPACSRERHSSKYYAVGNPSSNLDLSINIDPHDDFYTDYKSFNPTGTEGSCSNMCDTTDGCIGFIYDNSRCKLLKNDVIIPKGSSISYSHEIESTLYLKSSNNLHFEDRIFLSEYISSVPPRYWLVKQTKHFIQIVPGAINRLSFVPTYTIIYGSYIGIYCRFLFSYDEIETILQRGETNESYIHYPGTEITIPNNWKYYSPLYVTYLRI